MKITNNLKKRAEKLGEEHGCDPIEMARLLALGATEEDIECCVRIWRQSGGSPTLHYVRALSAIEGYGMV